MCCRYTLLKEHLQPLLEKLGILLNAGPAQPSRYNIAPGGRILAIRQNADRVALDASSNALRPARELTSLHWGLIPSWARDSANPIVNARAETLADKPSFRDAFVSRRRLIPASGFYEWKVIGRARQPWLFRLRDESPFALAGIQESWRSPDGAVLESCAVVTSAPNTLMEPIHHRMPVILASPDAWDAWLDPRNKNMNTLYPRLRPFPSEAMTAIAVSPRVNNTRNDDLDCLTPADVADDYARAHDPQLSLGF